MKTKNLPLALVYILYDKVLCSKQISELFIGKDYNNRNIQKYLNELTNESVVNFVGIGLDKKYKKSKFFTTNKDVLADKIIQDLKRRREEDESKAKELNAMSHNIQIPSSKDDALKYFLNQFEVHRHHNEEKKAWYIYLGLVDSDGSFRTIAVLKKLP
jgi:hypothetical protein